VVEVSELETISKIKSCRHMNYPCAVLVNFTLLCDQLIESVHSRKIFVFGLKKSIDEPKLVELFIKFGEIEAVRIVRNSNDFRSKGYGFVIYKDPKGRQAALRCEGIPYEDKFIQWIPYRDDSKSPERSLKQGSDDKSQQKMLVGDTCMGDQKKESFLERQSTGLKGESGSVGSGQNSPSQLQYRQAPSKSIWVPMHGDLDHQYKFNRSRIISSAAVREYFRRMGQYEVVLSIWQN
jgi:RNA recognition motif-containing protein